VCVRVQALVHASGIEMAVTYWPDAGQGWSRGGRRRKGSLGLEEERAAREPLLPCAHSAMASRELGTPPDLEHSAPKHVVGSDDGKEVAGVEESHKQR